MKLGKAHKHWLSFDDQELNAFMSEKILMRVCTFDGNGDPNLVPIWFGWDNGIIYTTTNKDTVKVSNLRRNSKVGFLIDAGPPNKGVHGVGSAELIEEKEAIRAAKLKLLAKYDREPESPFGQRILSADSVLIRIVPSRISSWDAGKSRT
jgi:general stress protein 26